MANITEIMQLCRLCLVKEQVNVPIFEGAGDIRQTLLKIKLCLPVKVDREDNLPKKICEGCVYKLDLLYEFYNTASKSEKQLLSWLSATDDNIVETKAKIDTIDEDLVISPTQIVLKEEPITDHPNDVAHEDHFESEFNNFYEGETNYHDAPETITTSELVGTDGEPPSKRPRRAAAAAAASTVALAAAESDDDDDEDVDDPTEHTITKTEDESEEEEDLNEDLDSTEAEPAFVDVSQDANPDAQPGPSGIQKAGDSQKRRKDRLFNKYKRQFNLKECVILMGDLKAIDLAKYTLVKAKSKPISGELLRTNIMSDPRRNKYKCEKCALRFKDYNQLKEHKLVHQKEKNGEAIAEIEEVIVDEVERYSDSSISAVVSGGSSSDEENEDDDLDDTILQQLYPCNFCDKVFKYDYTYAKHLKRHKLLACVKCNKVVKTKDELNEHLQKEHNYCPCKFCPQLFYSQTNLNAHMKQKHYKKPFMCPACGIKFDTSEELKEHSKVHMEDVVCDLCDAKFKSEKALEKHQATHFGAPGNIKKPQKPDMFRCNVCGISFIGKAFLEQHLHEHLNDDNNSPILNEDKEVEKSADTSKLPKLTKISTAVSSTTTTSIVAQAAACNNRSLFISLSGVPGGNTATPQTQTFVQKPNSVAFNPNQLKLIMINDKSYAILPEGTPVANGMIKLMINDPNQAGGQTMLHAIPALQPLGLQPAINQTIVLPNAQANSKISITNKSYNSGDLNQGTTNILYAPKQGQNAEMGRNVGDKMVMPTIVKVASAGEAVNMANLGISMANTIGGMNLVSSTAGVMSVSSNPIGSIALANTNLTSNPMGSTNMGGYTIANTTGGLNMVNPMIMGSNPIGGIAIATSEANAASSRIINITLPSGAVAGGVNIGGNILIGGANTEKNRISSPNQAMSSTAGGSMSSLGVVNLNSPALDMRFPHLAASMGVPQIKIIGTPAPQNVGGIVFSTGNLSGGVKTTNSSTTVLSSSSSTPAGARVITSNSTTAGVVRVATSSASALGSVPSGASILGGVTSGASTSFGVRVVTSGVSSSGGARTSGSSTLGGVEVVTSGPSACVGAKVGSSNSRALKVATTAGNVRITSDPSTTSSVRVVSSGASTVDVATLKTESAKPASSTSNVGRIEGEKLISSVRGQKLGSQRVGYKIGGKVYSINKSVASTTKKVVSTSGNSPVLASQQRMTLQTVDGKIVLPKPSGVKTSTSSPMKAGKIISIIRKRTNSQSASDAQDVSKFGISMPSLEAQGSTQRESEVEVTSEQKSSNTSEAREQKIPKNNTTISSSMGNLTTEEMPTGSLFESNQNILDTKNPKTIVKPQHNKMALYVNPEVNPCESRTNQNTPLKVVNSLSAPAITATISSQKISSATTGGLNVGSDPTISHANSDPTLDAKSESSNLNVNSELANLNINSLSPTLVTTSKPIASTSTVASKGESDGLHKPKIFLKPLSQLLEKPDDPKPDDPKPEDKTPESPDESENSASASKVKKLYKCNECSATCKRQGKLYQHLNKYKCKLCEFGSCKLKILDAHYSEKHEYKNRCVSCDTQFPSLTDLQQHKKTIHLCKQCNRCYFDLTKHQNNYRCCNCEFFACSASGLDTHYKLVHRITTRCAPCNKTFYSNETFQQHKQEIHYCERCCTYKMDLNVHKTFCKGTGQPAVSVPITVEEVIELDSD